MNIAIIFFTALANVFLQGMSRNVVYAYVFIVYTLAAISLELFDRKFGKIFMSLIFCLYAILLFVCVYNHIVFDVILYDYIIISVETIIVAILTIIEILPQVKITPRVRSGG